MAKKTTKVSPATLAKIKKDGMKKALMKTATFKVTPEYAEGVERMYGQKRIIATQKTPAAIKIAGTAKNNVKNPEKPGLNSQDVKKFLKGAGKENLEIAKMLGKAFGAYTKATTIPAVTAAKTIKKIASKKPPRK
jgi:hypothetical protein